VARCESRSFLRPAVGPRLINYVSTNAAQDILSQHGTEISAGETDCHDYEEKGQSIFRLRHVNEHYGCARLPRPSFLFLAIRRTRNQRIRAVIGERPHHTTPLPALRPCRHGITPSRADELNNQDFLSFAAQPLSAGSHLCTSSRRNSRLPGRESKEIFHPRRTTRQTDRKERWWLVHILPCQPPLLVV
jgi:hypothetical protein